MEFLFLHSSLTKVVFVSKGGMSGALILGKNTGITFLPIQQDAWSLLHEVWENMDQEAIWPRNQIYGRVTKMQEKIHFDFNPASWNPSCGFFTERWHELSQKLLFLPTGLLVSGSSWQTIDRSGQWPDHRWKKNSDLQPAQEIKPFIYHKQPRSQLALSDLQIAISNNNPGR